MPIASQCVTNPNLFVVSGAPGSGKTTLMHELGKLGFPHAPEVARKLIQEQVDQGGTALPWHDREAYTHLMLQRSIVSFLRHTPALKPMFTDRGIPDSLCYARLIGMGEVTSLLSACLQYRYAPLVFLAPPWEEIYCTDSERKQDFAEAVQTFELLVEVYRECGYTVLELPKLPPAARAEYVCDQLRGVAIGRR